MLGSATGRWLASSTILAIGIVIGGFALGDGIKRAQRADRAVTVKGLAERNVTADLATWTISYSANAPDVATAQASVDRDTAQIRAFFRELGFPAEALQPTGVNVNQMKDNGIVSFTVRQRVSLRTTDIKRAENAVRRQFDLVRRGVILEEGSGMAYAFTKLNDIKPQMVATATQDARAAAEQFAKDSGAEVGAIKSAAQGYFSIESRDGDSGGGWGQSDTPYKKVRVVTTIDFYLK
ncbi:SIMPL domain-containing protein [Novosphingobium kaempferiae]|uniref:SIMPL domain-containing protein n=1 Tax=Novosphingobium kaempferiae TaxID=2896849 RepID=UPI001E2BBDA9|nr:SIMPL domain-containing protein [Novosphingobium kaempferiae]